MLLPVTDDFFSFQVMSWISVVVHDSQACYRLRSPSGLTWKPQQSCALVSPEKCDTSAGQGTQKHPSKTPPINNWVCVGGGGSVNVVI